ncbi:MAG TPA: tripartite tricarboxylate transporter substrate-binding protein [Reyranella sp.]|nr:tripartite tricarboxylate transporter substrate-binding protein [Reyranella sp.]
MPNRRRFMALSAALFAAEASRVGEARTLDRPARLLVGFPAGSSPDFVARLLAEHLRDYASTIVVDNRPGAGGRLPLEALKAADHDGSVMVLTPGDQVALFPHVYAKLGYDSERDFAPVSTLCTVQFILAVGPLVPPEVKSVADFVAWCRANPKHANYGSPGEGTRPHFMGASFAREAGLEMTHVPYKGGPPIVQDLLAGQIACSLTVVSNALSNVQSGQLRALAITAPKRSPILPNVPTIREAGYPAAEGVEFFELFVPAGTPENRIARLNAQVRAALDTDALKDGLAKQGFEPAPSTPAELRQLIESDISRWGAVVKQTGFKPID